MSSSLPLRNLSDRHPGVTKVIGPYYEEAAGVCLDRDHRSPVVISVRDSGTEVLAILTWDVADEAVVRAWANDIDATEAGACGLALASVELTRNMVAIRRAETRTGADYYVDMPGTAPDNLETAVRLEISGTADPNHRVLDARLAAKLRQAAAGASNLPAMAVVVGFAQKRILSADV